MHAYLLNSSAIQGCSIMKIPVNRLAQSGIPTGWITSPGPIAGTAVQVNLSSLDRLIIKNSGASNARNDLDMTIHDPLKEESAHLGLVPFILEKFSFKKTSKLNESELNGRLEALIGSATSKNHRHSLLWSCSVPEAQIADSVALLSELSQGPGRFNDEDIEEIYQMLKYDAWEMRQELHFEDLLKDLIHRTAYSSSQTILPLTSPSVLFGREEADDLRKDEICGIIKRATEVIKEYWEETVLREPGEHFCIVGGGAEEASESIFNKAVLEHFDTHNNENDSKVTESSSQSQAYVGGMLNWQTPDHPLCNVSMALKCPAASDLKSHIPLAILQMLLGGGGSFSAGGPGKGMYSRLYTQMLNRYSWLEHARVFSQEYQSKRIGGLFGINASCIPKYAPSLVKLMTSYLSNQLTASLTTIELSRAKNQLKSAILMGMESRQMMLESYAQQLTSDTFIPPRELCKRIDETGEEELKAVAKEMASQMKVSVAAYGQIESVPSYNDISGLFKQQLELMK